MGKNKILEDSLKKLKSEVKKKGYSIKPNEPIWRKVANEMVNDLNRLYDSNKKEAIVNDILIHVQFNCIIFGNTKDSKFQKFIFEEAEMWSELNKDIKKEIKKTGETKRF